MSPSTTLSRAFILVEHKIDFSRSLLTIITSLLKRQQIVYLLHKKKLRELYFSRALRETKSLFYKELVVAFKTQFDKDSLVDNVYIRR